MPSLSDLDPTPKFLCEDLTIRQTFIYDSADPNRRPKTKFSPTESLLSGLQHGAPVPLVLAPRHFRPRCAGNEPAV